MATMAISTKTRSVGALLLLVAVLVGTSAPGVHAAGSVTVGNSIVNLCPTNVSVVIFANLTLPLLPPIIILNETVAANVTVILPLLPGIGNIGINISIGGNVTIPVPLQALESGLLANLTSIINGLGPLGALLTGLLGLLPLPSINGITLNCSDTSCGTAGLVAANTSVTVLSILGATAKVCI